MDELTVGILFVLAGVVGYLVFLLRKLIITKIGQEKYDFINKVIEDIVRYVEQMGVNIGWFPEDKKKMAVSLCNAALKKLGFEANPELIERLIERAVQILNGNTISLPEEKPVTSADPQLLPEQAA
jgi:hypothetical protein